MTTISKTARYTSDSLDLFASLIALAAHPIVIGVLGLLTVVLSSAEIFTVRLFYLTLLVTLTFVPAALYLFVFFRGNVMDMLELIHREARLTPYILMIIGAVIAAGVLFIIDAPRPIFIMTIVLLANEVVLGTVNFWTKVSIHTATTTFTAITLGYLLNSAWYALIFLVPLIAWARIYRQRHTLAQVTSGAIFAALITTFVIALSHQLFEK